MLLLLDPCFAGSDVVEGCKKEDLTEIAMTEGGSQNADREAYLEAAAHGSQSIWVCVSGFWRLPSIFRSRQSACGTTCLTIKIEVPTDSSIEDLQSRLEAIMEVPVAEQRVITFEKVPDSHTAIADLGPNPIVELYDLRSVF